PPGGSFYAGGSGSERLAGRGGRDEPTKTVVWIVPAGPALAGRRDGGRRRVSRKESHRLPLPAGQSGEFPHHFRRRGSGQRAPRPRRRGRRLSLGLPGQPVTLR